MPGFRVPQREPYCCFRLQVIPAANPRGFPTVGDNLEHSSGSSQILSPSWWTLGMSQGGVGVGGGGLCQGQGSLLVRAPLSNSSLLHPSSPQLGLQDFTSCSLSFPSREMGSLEPTPEVVAAKPLGKRLVARGCHGAISSVHLRSKTFWSLDSVTLL